MLGIIMTYTIKIVLDNVPSIKLITNLIKILFIAIITLYKLLLNSEVSYIMNLQNYFDQMFL